MSSLPTPPDQAPNKKVNDEEKRSQKANIQRIEDYRDRIAEYQLWFAQNELSGDVSQRDQQRSYHQLARGFLQLIRPQLTDPEIIQNIDHPDPDTHSPEYDNPYWTRIPIGAWTIDPPDILQRPSQLETEHAVKNNIRSTLARADPRVTADPRTIEVIGLRQFAALEPERTIEWTAMFGPNITPSELREQTSDDQVTVHDRSHHSEPIKVTKQVLVPKFIIDNAIETTEHFIRQIGLGIELTNSGVPEWGFQEVHDDGED